MKIRCTINGNATVIETAGARRLLDVLREDLDLTGTKEGCGEGECGACSVLIGEDVVNSCLVPVGQIGDQSVVTIEALEKLGGRGLQRAFIENGAAQCGICTPGMLLSAFAFLLRRSGRSGVRTSRLEIREAIAGNLCRCTGYQKIVDAIMDAMEQQAPGTEPGEMRCQ